MALNGSPGRAKFPILENPATTTSSNPDPNSFTVVSYAKKLALISHVKLAVDTGWALTLVLHPYSLSLLNLEM